MLSIYLQLAIRIGLALAAVASLTWVDFHILHVNSATAAFSFLVVVLGFAARAGLPASIAASFASMFAYNYFFLPPVGSFTIADPQNWAAMAAFLITALTGSHLSASARLKAEEAAKRQQELQRMYEFSRAMMLWDPDRTVATHTPGQIAEIFRVEDVWFCDSDTGTVISRSSNDSPLTSADMQQVAETGQIWRDRYRGAFIVPVSLGGHRLGSIGVAGSVVPSEVALQAIAQLVAIGIERGRAQQIANRMAATRQNEQLKSTLLDALAHEFKTPLTSIKAATTSLLPRPNLDAIGRELLTIIDEEADRLTSLVSDSIELARIGSGPVTLHCEPCLAETLISAAVTQLRGLFEGRIVDLDLEQDLPFLNADRKLSELIVRQLLSNALKYSPPSSPIRITCELEGDFAVIRVRNAGPGIPQAEQEALFEKFYRSAETYGRVPGTGMGLAIAREVVNAHGGRIWVESAPDEGAQFCFTLPLAESTGKHLHVEGATVA